MKNNNLTIKTKLTDTTFQVKISAPKSYKHHLIDLIDTLTNKFDYLLEKEPSLEESIIDAIESQLKETDSYINGCKASSSTGITSQKPKETQTDLNKWVDWDHFAKSNTETAIRPDYEDENNDPDYSDLEVYQNIPDPTRPSEPMITIGKMGEQPSNLQEITIEPSEPKSLFFSLNITSKENSNSDIIYINNISFIKEMFDETPLITNDRLKYPFFNYEDINISKLSKSSIKKLLFKDKNSKFRIAQPTKKQLKTILNYWFNAIPYSLITMDWHLISKTNPLNDIIVKSATLIDVAKYVNNNEFSYFYPIFNDNLKNNLPIPTIFKVIPNPNKTATFKQITLQELFEMLNKAKDFYLVEGSTEHALNNSKQETIDFVEGFGKSI